MGFRVGLKSKHNKENEDLQPGMGWGRSSRWGVTKRKGSGKTFLPRFLLRAGLGEKASPGDSGGFGTYSENRGPG